MSKKLELLLAAMLFTTASAIAAPNFDYSQNSQTPLYQPNYYNVPTVSGNQTLKGSV